MVKSKHIILGVSGSIAAYKSADLLRALIEEGHRVSVVMTKEAEQFITPLTLGALSGEHVYRASISDEENSWKMPHIELAQKADMFLISPATANIIAKLACGLGDDLLTTIALVTKAPLVLVPAMNTEMYQHALVQENCSKLKKLGAHFIEPQSGKLACGTIGQGHIANEETIVKAVLKLLK